LKMMQSWWTDILGIIGLSLSSSILKTATKHSISESRSDSILTWAGRRQLLWFQWLGLALSRGPNTVGAPHLRME
jgi:hypothetical protein